MPVTEPLPAIRSAWAQVCRRSRHQPSGVVPRQCRNASCNAHGLMPAAWATSSSVMARPGLASMYPSASRRWRARRRVHPARMRRVAVSPGIRQPRHQRRFHLSPHQALAGQRAPGIRLGHHEQHQSPQRRARPGGQVQRPVKAQRPVGPRAQLRRQMVHHRLTVIETSSNGGAGCGDCKARWPSCRAGRPGSGARWSMRLWRRAFG